MFLLLSIQFVTLQGNTNTWVTTRMSLGSERIINYTHEPLYAFNINELG